MLRTRWRGAALGLAVGLSWLLAVCNSQSPPVQVPAPTCYPRPEPTGEKVIRLTVEATPPAQVSPGQVITMVFSGDYIILNNAIVCGGTIVGHMHGDEFPAFSWNRTIKMLWDEHPLTTLECGYTCRVEVTIPQDTPMGAHELILETKWERVVFVLQVI